MAVTSSPHDFHPLRWWDRFRRGGRCRHCYIPAWGHPVRCWIEARPIGDNRRLSWKEAIRRQFNLEHPDG